MISNYKRIEDHFNHPSLSEIKEAILLIGHVPANGSIITDMKPPQVQHTKDIAWKIKCSTLSLPMLDILNRNFPKLLNDLTLCLLCKSNVETNNHIWICPAPYINI
ncbi:uncharacterized protein OCT59_029311 [Rhizophagus irregularis]|nr:hypothetical protein RirG_105810 [Rhizophagus irregularis DAOM 197198w]UZO09074.1 hypothetical protein OCT59_029311 [Rhizophagus irregularis]